jgi:hypothetical protein
MGHKWWYSHLTAAAGFLLGGEKLRELVCRKKKGRGLHYDNAKVTTVDIFSGSILKMQQMFPKPLHTTQFPFESHHSWL